MHYATSSVAIVAAIFCLPLVAQTDPSAAPTNPVQEKLSAASAEQRQTMLSAYLTKAGEKCAVSKTFYQGNDHRGNVFWNTACTEGTSFVIQIFNNEINSTRIVNCERLKEITGNTCFTKFKQ